MGIRDVPSACYADEVKMQSRRTCIYNGHTLVKLLHYENKENHSTVQGIDRLGCNGNDTINVTPEPVPLDTFIAQRTVPEYHQKKMGGVNRGIQLVWMDFTDAKMMDLR